MREAGEEERRMKRQGETENKNPKMWGTILTFKNAFLNEPFFLSKEKQGTGDRFSVGGCHVGLVPLVVPMLISPSASCWLQPRSLKTAKTNARNSYRV